MKEIEHRRELFRLARSGQRPPRWPVSVRCSDVHNADIHGVGRAEYLNDPVTHAEAQIAGRKWMLENIQSDASYVVVCPLLAAGPSAFGAEIVVGGSGRAWIEPWIDTGADLQRLEGIDPNVTGSSAVYMQWCEVYERIAEQYPVRFEDGEEFFPLAGQTRPLTTGSSGPFSLAADLMGKDRLMSRLEIDPHFVDDLLDILTDKIIDTLKRNRRAEGYDGTVFLSSSSTGDLTAEQFEEFALPCLLDIKDALGRDVTLHQSKLPPEHIEPILRKLKPKSISGFRCENNDLEGLAEIAYAVKGRCYLEPALNGRSLAAKSEDEILSDAMQTLMLFDHFGNFNLSASAPDAMEFADLPKLNAIHRASKAMTKN